MSRRACSWAVVSGGFLFVVAGHAATVDVQTSPVVEVQQLMSGSPLGQSSFELRICRGIEGEGRGVYEWPIPALAAGSTITAVNYNAFVTGYQSNNGVYPNISFHGYAGDGIYAVSDASVPFNKIGQTGPINAGFTQSYALSASYVQSLVNAGTPYLGTMLYAEQPDLYGRFSRTGVYAGVPRLQVVANVPDTGTVHAKPLFDVTASSSGAGAFTVSDGNTAINTQYYPLASVDRRGLMEFDLAGVPHGATITGATLTFNVNAITYGGDGSGITYYPQVRLYAYAGNLAAEASDATNLAYLVGTSDPVATTGVAVNVNLDVARIQSLLATNDLLGVTAFGSANGQQFGFYTSEMSLALAPMLNISYAVPEPGALGLLVPALCGLGRRTCRRPR